MGLHLKQELTLQLPMGKLKAKYKSAIFYKRGADFHRTPNYIEVGEEIYFYSLDDQYIADIGNGNYLKEVDFMHFDIYFGTVRINGPHVHAYSKNGKCLRKLQKGREYRVRAIHPRAEGIVLYQINNVEYISSADKVEFIRGIFVPSVKVVSVNGKKPKEHLPGERLEFSTIRNNYLELLDGSKIFLDNCKGQFI